MGDRLILGDSLLVMNSLLQRDGSGQGLALHSTMMAIVGGMLATESIPNQSTRVVLELP